MRGGAADTVVTFWELMRSNEVKGGKISRIVEFWPELYPAPENRRCLTEPRTQAP